MHAECSQSQKAKLFDQSLRLIVKLMQASVTFTVFDDIMVRWLEAASEESSQKVSRLLRS